MASTASKMHALFLADQGRERMIWALQKQLLLLGRPDVVMIPADGSWTMSFADVLTVIEQLRPSLIIPMHIDTPQQALTFVQHTGRRYAVRQVSERSLTLSRQLLPAAATIVLFGGS
jgi:L-ascorbate metabolism protein UlaG (beta-lactamase superfamily)